eukprot:15082910-Alexandrium_andersonii.AAC.1
MCTVQHVLLGDRPLCVHAQVLVWGPFGDPADGFAHGFARGFGRILHGFCADVPIGFAQGN